MVQLWLQEKGDNRQQLQICRGCYSQSDTRIITHLFMCITGVSLTSLFLVYPSVLTFHCVDWRPSGVACGSFLGMSGKRGAVLRSGAHPALEYR